MKKHALSLLISAILLCSCSSASSKLEKELTETRATVYEYINSGEYYAALEKAQSLIFPEDYSSEKHTYWENEREKIIAEIRGLIVTSIESKLVETRSEIQDCLNKEDFDTALVKAQTLSFPDEYSSDKHKYWEKERKAIIKDIENAKKKKEKENSPGFFEGIFGGNKDN